eukprot:2338293-Rhodomonas_salina.4
MFAYTGLSEAHCKVTSAACPRMRYASSGTDALSGARCLPTSTTSTAPRTAASLWRVSTQVQSGNYGPRCGFEDRLVLRIGMMFPGNVKYIADAMKDALATA